MAQDMNLIASADFRRAPFSLRGGSIVALPTPFLNDAIDETALAALCARHVSSGTNAIVVCGTTGEAPALSAAEQRRAIEVAVEAVGGRIPVIAGAGTSGTTASITLARQAEQAGAAALLCVTPYYVRPTQEGIYQHMRAMHDAVKIPIILYDVPGRTGCAMADDTVVRLACLDRVIGIKDATGNVERVRHLRSRVKREFLLLSGDDQTQAQHRWEGGDGCISVTANVAPILCADMHKAWDRNDFRTFNRIAEHLAPLSRALFVESNPIPVKRALHRMGLMTNEIRGPLLPLGPEHEGTVEAAVNAVMTAERKASRTDELIPPRFVPPEILARVMCYGRR